jgi:hypothetical protein
MMRKALLLLLTAMAFVAAPAHAQREFLCGFTGFDYVPGSPQGATPFIASGQGYEAVGFVTSFSPLFTGSLLPGSEHTFHLFGAVAGPTFWDGVVLEVQFAPHARLRIFEDPANNGDYGVTPPNATAPASFTDGTLILGADINNLVLVYDYDSNQGNFQAGADLDEGSLVGLIAPSRRSGWVVSGQAGRPNATVPSGYVNQLNGEIQIPDVTPTEHKSWGSIKALYR